MSSLRTSSGRQQIRSVNIHELGKCMGIPFLINYLKYRVSSSWLCPEIASMTRINLGWLFFLLRHSFPPLNVSGFFWCWLETINHHHTWDRVIWRRAYQPTPTSLDKSIHVMLHVMKLTSSLMQLQLPSWKSNLSSFHLACVITVFVYILTLI